MGLTDLSTQVRAAAKFDALIVPFGAVGAADSVTFIRDKSGEQPNIPSARRWANRTEDFRFPLAVPQSPRRFYFLFGDTIATADLDPNDRAACAATYADAKAAVRGALDYLLEERKADAYESPLLRIPLETATGTPAPTFDLAS